jgi:flagellar L-ring protein precursor FlgH
MNMRISIGPLTVAAYDAALQAAAFETDADLPVEQLFPLLRVIAAPRNRRLRVSDVARKIMSARGSSSAKKSMRATAGALLILLTTVGMLAQTPLAAAPAKAGSSSKRPGISSDPAASSLESYLTRVRLDNKAVQSSTGAIWTDSGRLTRMSTDVRAMRPHDLISVVVSESLAASTDGTVKNSRASNASSGISGLIGTLHAGNALQNLVNQNSASGLNAQGASATNSSLTTTFGGQVVEVLPNGMLVIEAARQVEFSQQTQTIVLRGLVRPEDISQQNQVLSTAISSMELQVRGKGIVNDYTHRQNPVVRFLQWVLVF